MLVLNSNGCMTFGRFAPCVDTIALSKARIEEIMRKEKDALVLFEGGADINPELYGEENRKSWFSIARDTHEAMLYALAREYNVPMLGICRGHQLMAALAGGTLYQDIATDLGKSHRHRHAIEFTEYAREVQFTKLMETNPTGCPDVVNSLHHQAIKLIPADARVLAYAEDRTPEALWYPYGISVQWHPELLRHYDFLPYMHDRFMK